MILSGALLAFLLSIFGQPSPSHQLYLQPEKGHPAQELRGEKCDSLARPTELIDGAYATKK